MVQIENRVSATLSTGPRLTQMTKYSEAFNVGTIQFEAYSLYKMARAWELFVIGTIGP